ncbi:hypothetical protein NDU88_011316 [Pleurodeles waltl]|uniref:Uncharacterized protein n=1 Tax=Pleurodeles waltl TaxID=8319 RepID=A0AAV7Q0E1_PLEWA|nr:hypothetical protein NDU88_011316 [Pleurodeles waltl]
MVLLGSSGLEHFSDAGALVDVDAEATFCFNAMREVSGSLIHDEAHPGQCNRECTKSYRLSEVTPKSNALSRVFTADGVP